MQTKCPQCKAVFPIKLDQLRSARGTVQCGECFLKFNALSALYENGEIEHLPQNAISASSIPVLHQEQEREKQPLKTEVSPPNSDPTEALTAPWEAEKPPANRGAQFFWLFGSFAALCLLVGQLYLNEAQNNFPNQTARAIFELGCKQLNCKLPPLRKVSSIDVVDRSIQTEQNALLLKITLANHALHVQPFPNLKLTLSDFKNRPIAQRIFNATEYLPQNDPRKLMAVDEPIELQLVIAPFKEKIATFSFELL
ncbi:MAG: hypothetical protein DRQ56_08590 [Gammaproteobacteria bacterium]|nr:MAG: hypothetical protein DRQ56_08590 [Gammaproteobacteria bacterium]